jgi:exonuclease V
MKQGSAVHKTLEDQVHTTVAVDITSNEDAWGLRIWNVIQGLRTLRDTGMTRELEIWGTVDGLVVNGVIDELSYICPDRELEEADENGKAPKMVPLQEDQTTITDFLGPATLENDGAEVLKSTHSLLKKTEKLYICDVKTRGVRSIPKGASFRPTLMQLMIYHRLLSDLATNKVDADVLFDRYNINASNPFSDSFIAQIGSLNDPYNSSTPELSTQDSMTTLLSHNSPRALWSLMISEFALTLPLGTRSLGSVLKAEYRDQTNGEVMGIKTFLYDETLISGYVEDEMRWWKGEREAQGVAVEEAYKCGVCEFAEECWWRKEKVEEQRLKMREKGRARSSV